MQRYWLGVCSNQDMRDYPKEQKWFCGASETQVGDELLMYLPRSASQNYNGVFARYRVSATPDVSEDDRRFFCSGYAFGGLKYVEIEYVQQYKHPLTAKEIKQDPYLRMQQFSRRNFQGTIFKIKEKCYEKICAVLEEKNG